MSSSEFNAAEASAAFTKESQNVDELGFKTIVLSRDGRVGTITLDRPKAMNALNSQMMCDVITAARQLDADPRVGAIVIIGSEKAFAAGADIKEMKDKEYPDIAAERLFADWQQLRQIRTPIITAVSGYALGGGCELAMLGDILLAAENAKFGQPEITLGVIPGMGGTQRMARAIGKAKTMDLVLTGRTMGAEEAERAGLVARILPTENFAEEVATIAAKVASMGTFASAAAAEAVDRAFESSLSEGLVAERESFYSLFATDDQKEGMAAFVEKRKPHWEHNQHH